MDLKHSTYIYQCKTILQHTFRIVLFIAHKAAGNDSRTVLTKKIFGALQRKQFFARYKLDKLQKIHNFSIAWLMDQKSIFQNFQGPGKKHYQFPKLSKTRTNPV
jgi:hypothetical protein